MNVLPQSNVPSHDLQARVITVQDPSAAHRAAQGSIALGERRPDDDVLRIGPAPNDPASGGVRHVAATLRAWDAVDGDRRDRRTDRERDERPVEAVRHVHRLRARPRRCPYLNDNFGPTGGRIDRPPRREEPFVQISRSGRQSEHFPLDLSIGSAYHHAMAD